MKVVEQLGKKYKTLQEIDAQIIKLEKLALTLTFEDAIIKFYVEQLTENI